MAQDHRIGQGAMDQPHRDTGVPYVCESPLPLDEDVIVPLLHRPVDLQLHGTGYIITDDRIDSDAAALNENPGLPGPDEIGLQPAPLEVLVHFKDRGHLADITIRA